MSTDVPGLVSEPNADHPMYTIQLKNPGVQIQLSSDDPAFISRQMEQWFNMLQSNDYVPLSFPKYTEPSSPEPTVTASQAPAANNVEIPAPAPPPPAMPPQPYGDPTMGYANGMNAQLQMPPGMQQMYMPPPGYPHYQAGYPQPGYGQPGYPPPGYGHPIPYPAPPPQQQAVAPAPVEMLVVQPAVPTEAVIAVQEALPEISPVEPTPTALEPEASAQKVTTPEPVEETAELVSQQVALPLDDALDSPSIEAAETTTLEVEPETVITEPEPIAVSVMEEAPPVEAPIEPEITPEPELPEISTVAVEPEPVMEAPELDGLTPSVAPTSDPGEEDFEAVLGSIMEDMGEPAHPVPSLPMTPSDGELNLALASGGLGQPSLNNNLNHIEALSDLCEQTRPETAEGFLLTSGYYLAFFEAEERFSLKRLNSMLVKNGYRPINHSVLESALHQGFITMLPDATGNAEASEYAMTDAGQAAVEQMLG